MSGHVLSCLVLSCRLRLDTGWASSKIKVAVRLPLLPATAVAVAAAVLWRWISSTNSKTLQGVRYGEYSAGREIWRVLEGVDAGSSSVAAPNDHNQRCFLCGLTSVFFFICDHNRARLSRQASLSTGCAVGQGSERDLRRKILFQAINWIRSDQRPNQIPSIFNGSTSSSGIRISCVSSSSGSCLSAQHIIHSQQA